MWTYLILTHAYRVSPHIFVTYFFHKTCQVLVCRYFNGLAKFIPVYFASLIQLCDLFHNPLIHEYMSCLSQCSWLSYVDFVSRDFTELISWKEFVESLSVPTYRHTLTSFFLVQSVFLLHDWLLWLGIPRLYWTEAVEVGHPSLTRS